MDLFSHAPQTRQGPARWSVVYYPLRTPAAPVVISLCLTVLAAPMAAIDCADWNSSKYFQVAGVEHVAACLASGADPKTGDKHGETPLRWAAAFNKNSAVIAVLLDAGADIEARGPHMPVRQRPQGGGAPALRATD